MTDNRQQITVLGSTGSIGDSALEVIELNAERYRVFALTANCSYEKMHVQCLRFQPRYAVMKDAEAAEQLRGLVGKSALDTEVLAGLDGLCEVASHKAVDTVIAGIVGAAGLLPTLAAAESGKRILLANKEALVMTGDLLLECARKGGATLLPVDSEHNALFQCMPQSPAGVSLAGVDKIILTASGGPFRGKTHEELQGVTPAQAVAHPNWSMGKKISVDSATLMNKGLEVIEACYLFGVAAERVSVVVHPESIIHSMVSYKDGSVLAQMGRPDMRTPIAHVLAWPERIASGVASLDLIEVSRLHFEEPDLVSFPCLQLAFDAVQRGGTAPIALNAANEVAVEEFLSGNMGFTEIAETISYVLGAMPVDTADTLDKVLLADRQARELAIEYANQ